MSLVLRTLGFVIAVPGSVMVWIPCYLLNLWHGGTLVSHIYAVPVLFLGVATFLLCVFDFGSTGEGTPAPWDMPRKLVGVRLYVLCRNPMYVGVLLTLVGEAIWFASWSLATYAASVWALFHVFVLVIEEPQLRRKFGASYEQYCATTNRWLPRLP